MPVCVVDDTNVTVNIIGRICVFIVELIIFLFTTCMQI